MKKCLLFLLAGIFLLSGQCFAKPEYSLKLGHTGAPDHHYQDISTKFADKVKELTDGAVEIVVFPADQLGKQLEITEGAMMGTHDLALTSDTVLSNWIPEMGILNLPFMFNDMNEYRKVVDGPLGEKFAQLVEPHGAIVIGWWDNGMRHVTNNKRVINTPKDMEGLRIRVPEGDMFVETFKALGTNPTVVPFGELYTALQLNTVDGQENPPAHIVTQKFYEVQNNVSRTGHIHMGSPLIMNKALFDSMPKKYQDAILKTAREMGPVHTKMVDDLEQQQWKEIGDHGMVITDVDKAPFREAVKPVIDNFKKKVKSPLVDEVQSTLAK